ncbi:cell division protein FtsQ/DivIB [Zeaxanthinibacter sp. PT1]|uniref:cell division protein FtsQ/DivIB n=1 Tax=Zeaxanthinibacter TaxID=561554 RepID=UPI00234B9A7F|nr:cell division protein FtsQ/DivIB [Zeaxanthinibacter sp. PT1]MDC6349963.1 cell division protein FtsQ/DivIB [Zeaxanthinibacter sp. PT1]
MKAKLNYLKLAGLMICVIGLYAFSSKRSADRNVQGIRISFVGSDNLYVTEETVNKLLIQKYGRLSNVPKENIALNTIEEVIETNEMVKDAQVFLTVNGELTTKIEQRQPIGRIEGYPKYYLDEEGKRMPLSSNHSARVPIITGKITGKALEDAYVILKYINTDDFLRKNVIGIHILEEGNYQLKFRVENFVVNLGGIEDLQKKFNNFKAFYAKAAKDRTLKEYDIVSLEFNNQVVCTKI